MAGVSERYNQFVQQSAQAGVDKATVQAEGDRIFNEEVLPSLQKANASPSVISAAKSQWGNITTRAQNMHGYDDATMAAKRQQTSDNALGGLGLYFNAGKAALNDIVVPLRQGSVNMAGGFARYGNDLINGGQKGTGLDTFANDMKDESNRLQTTASEGYQQATGVRGLANEAVQSLPNMILPLGAATKAAKVIKAVGGGAMAQAGAAIGTSVAMEYPQNYAEARDNTTELLNEKDPKTGEYKISTDTLRTNVPEFDKFYRAEFDKSGDLDAAKVKARELTVDYLSQQAAGKAAKVMQVLAPIGAGAGRLATKAVAGSVVEKMLPTVLRLNPSLTNAAARAAVTNAEKTGLMSKLPTLSMGGARTLALEGLEEGSQTAAEDYITQSTKKNAGGGDIDYGHIIGDAAHDALIGAVMGGGIARFHEGTIQHQHMEQINGLVAQHQVAADELSKAQNAATQLTEKSKLAPLTPEEQGTLTKLNEDIPLLSDAQQKAEKGLTDLGLTTDGKLAPVAPTAPTEPTLVDTNDTASTATPTNANTAPVTTTTEPTLSAAQQSAADAAKVPPAIENPSVNAPENAVRAMYADDIKSSRGNPFTSENAAKRALTSKGLDGTHDVVPVADGSQFVIRAKKDATTTTPVIDSTTQQDQPQAAVEPDTAIAEPAQPVISQDQPQAETPDSTMPKTLPEFAQAWVEAHKAGDVARKKQLLAYGNKTFDQQEMQNLVNATLKEHGRIQKPKVDQSTQSEPSVQPTETPQSDTVSAKEAYITAFNTAKDQRAQSDLFMQAVKAGNKSADVSNWTTEAKQRTNSEATQNKNGYDNPASAVADTPTGEQHATESTNAGGNGRVRQGTVESTAATHGNNPTDSGAGSLAGQGKVTAGVSTDTRTGQRPQETTSREPAKTVKTINGRPYEGDPSTDAQTGQPKVWHHGTRDEFSDFNLSHQNRKDHGWMGNGVYLTDNPVMAKTYSRSKRGTGKPRVMNLHIDAKKFYEISAEDKHKLSEGGAANSKAFTEYLKSQGYEGTILQHPNGFGHEISVFDPKHVKDVTHTQGTDQQSTTPASSDVIIRHNGEPFKSESGAESVRQSKGLTDTHDVVPHGSGKGYALKPKDAAKPQEAKPQEAKQPEPAVKPQEQREPDVGAARKLVSLYRTPSGKVGMEIWKTTRADGTETYSYNGMYGSGSGQSEAQIRSIVNIVKKRRKNVRHSAGIDFTQPETAVNTPSTKPTSAEPTPDHHATKEEAKPVEPEAKPSDTQFANNKVFTADRVAAARARLKSKMGRLNSGFDPEMLLDGMTIAGAYVESGIRSFSQFAKSMVDDFGDGIKPHLLSFWEGIRHSPELDTTGMTSAEESLAHHKELNQTIAPEMKAVIGEKAKPVGKRERPTGKPSDRTLRQDWGVQHIDGHTETPEFKDAEYTDQGMKGGVKDAFLKDAKTYLKAVETELLANGFYPHNDKKMKVLSSVNVNESGVSGSGDVTLTMQHGDSNTNVYVTIGDTSLRGVVPHTTSGIAMMYRVSNVDGDKYAAEGRNMWSPMGLTASEFAKVLQRDASALPKVAPTPDVAHNKPNHITETDHESAKLDQSGKGTLEGVSTDHVPQNEGGRNAGASPEGSGGTDLFGHQRPRTVGVATRRGVADGEGTLPPATRGKDSGRTTGRTQSDDVGATQGDQSTQVRDGRLIDGRGTASTGGSTVRRTESTDAVTAQDLPDSAFNITDEDAIGSGGAKTKFKNNIAAIRLLKQLNAEARNATKEEQKVLAKYVGWGGLANAFARDDGSVAKGWEKEAAELKGLLTDDEFKAAVDSSIAAHYTSPQIVSAIWDAVRQLGFTGGRVLEPSVGVGNFFGAMPKDLRTASGLHGVELDHITGGIAKQLYPAARIVAPMGFQDYTFNDGHFDLAIGNPPFGALAINDSARRAISGFSLHNYFFAKSLDSLREGGVLAMVVTNRLMDTSNANDKARQYMNQHAKMIGAIRLPNNAFLKNAGTEVTTDIIFLQKRKAGDTGGESWMTVKPFTDKQGKSVPLNEYFHRHPEMMLGEFGAYGSMYRGDDAALVARDGQDTAKLLADAVKKLPEGIMPEKGLVDEKETTKALTRDISDVKVGSMFVDGDHLRVREPDLMGEQQSTAVEGLSATAIERAKGMIGVREALAKLRSLQLKHGASDEVLTKLRQDLNTVYDAFVKKHGYINSDTNKRIFRDDPSYPQIAALEESYDKGLSKTVAEKTGESVRAPSAKKAAIFTKRTQNPLHVVESVNSAKDALVESLNRHGAINLDVMAKLYGKSPEEIIKELGDLVYQDPIGGWVTQDQYLSGNVKQKLAQAKEIAKSDKAYARNVEALERVQPEDIEPVDIDVKAGAHWIPADDMASFAAHIADSSRAARVSYNKFNGKWAVDSFESTPASQTQWGTDRVPAARIVEHALNQTQATVYDKQPDGSMITNADATAAANEKIARVKEEWKRWIWSDEARRERLAQLYNDSFNTDRQRQFDGSHLALQGKVSDSVVKLRPTQINAIWRSLQSETMLADHVVGAGKTFTLIGAAMEMRRMGLVQKPMFVVPNHLVGQWAADFMKLYPNANILAATKRDFEKGNRKKFMARVATGDWDAVIVAHSSFGKIKIDPIEEQAFIRDEIREIMDAEEQERAANGRNSRNAKDYAKRRLTLEERYKKLTDVAGKDEDNLFWHELGADALFVDEAHEFKNLGYTSGMDRVAGLGNQKGSQKANDLFMKIRSMNNNIAKSKVVFATGTPISNTMAEMFTMQRYLDLQRMKDQGLSAFDAWARMFGEVVTDWELSPSGKYKMNSRFAKFNNLPELMQRYLSFADVINRDDIARMGMPLNVPKVIGGKPQNIVVERSTEQADYIGEPSIDEHGNEVYPKGSLVWRSENLPKKAEKGADNMLKIMSDARKAALDMRMIDPSAPDNPNSKVNVAVKNIVNDYHKWSADKGTQLVFCDLSTPKGAVAGERARIEDLVRRADEGDETAIEELDKLTPDELDALNTQFSVYDDMKQKLIDGGIPAKEIAFIHDAKTDLQKEELYGKVRSGQVRVLLGSTAKMGAGMNVQERLVALHHLDAPWRPSDLEQREGRIIRQGNTLRERDPDGFEVGIYRYATKQTLDSRMWQTLEAKARFIEQVRKGNSASRSVEDVGGEAANSAEMKAASSGNPLILEEMNLRKQVKSLEDEHTQHNRDQYRIDREVKYAKKSIDVLKESISLLKKDLSVEIPKELAITVDGKEYKQGMEGAREQAGESLMKQAKLVSLTGGNRKVGRYGGFVISMHTDEIISGVRHVEVLLTSEHGGEYSLTIDPEKQSPLGLVTRITNLVSNLQDQLHGLETRLDTAEKSIPKLEAQRSTWNKQEELEDAKTQHRDVIEQLKPKKKVEPQQEGDKRFSRAEDVAFAHDALTELRDHDEMLRYPISKSSTIRGAMKDIFPDSKYLGETTRPDERQESEADQRYTFKTPENKEFHVYTRGNEVWIDVSQLDTGEGGARVYAAVGDYAKNARKVFVGDPKGLSEDARVRRTVNMLSLAFRHGTTDFMEAAKEQIEGNAAEGVVPLKWRGLSDVEKVRSLIDTFLQTTHNQFKGLDGYRYDFGTRQFLDRLGRPLGHERLDRGTSGEVARGARAGSATARRYIFLRSLVSSESGERPAILEQLLHRSSALAKSPELAGMFSTSENAQTSKEPLQTPDQVRQQLADRFGASTIDKLINNGKLEIIASHDDRTVEGFYQDGKTTLVAGNITPEHVVPTLLHEMGGHAGMQGLMRPATYTSIMEHFNRLVDVGNPIAVEAKRRAEAVERDPNVQQDEYLPYLITEAAKAQGHQLGAVQAVKRLIDRVVASVRAWAFDRLGVHIKLTPNDILALAERMVKQVGNQPTDPNGSKTRKSNSLIQVWRNIASHDDAFTLPRSQEKSLVGILQDNEGGLVKSVEPVNQDILDSVDAEKGWRVEFKPSESGKQKGGAYIYQKGNNVWIDVYESQTGEAGSRIYNTVANYAYNNGLKFIGDPIDLSVPAKSRRLENMLSSALKYGTTKHIEPHAKQLIDGHGVPALSWKAGDDDHNFEQMIRATHQATLNQIPDAANIRYNVETGQFEDRSNGQPISDTAFRHRAKEARTDATRRGVGITAEEVTAGSRTLKRMSITDTFLRGTSSERSKLLDGFSRDLPESVKKTLYSRSEPLTSDQQRTAEKFKEEATNALNWSLFKAGDIKRKLGVGLNTMLHKAETNPEIKPTFDLIQQKLNHTSVEAYDAIKQAPELLGETETLGDLKRSLKTQFSPTAWKKRNADIKAAGKAIFDGTLLDNKVYSDSELKDKFKLTPDQIKVYRDARKAIDISLDNSAKAIISRIAAVNGVDWATLHKIHGKDLGLDAHFDEVSKLLDADAIEEGAKDNMEDVVAQADRLKENGYAPLMRFGDYYIRITKKGDPDNVLYRQHFDSRFERDQVVKKLRAILPSDSEIKVGTINPKLHEMYSGVSPESVALFAKQSGLAQDEATQAYLKSVTANHSALRRMIHRQGIDGYSEDLQRVLAGFIMSNARHSASTLFNPSVDESVVNIKDGDIQKEAQELRDYALDPKENLQKLKNIMFIYTMGGSMMFALVNLTQPLMMTVPWLAQYAPKGTSAAKLIGRAYKVAGKTILTGETPVAYKEEYDRAQREGHIDAANVFMLQGIERGGSGLASSWWKSLSHVIGLNAQYSEMYNRRITLFAALDAARAMTPEKLKALGFDSPYEFAVKAIQQTQGVYNKGNRPKWARGNVGSVMMLYKQYSINYVEMLYRMAISPTYAGEKDKLRKAFWLAIGMLFAAAGATGLPFVKNLMDGVQTAAGATGHPINIEREVQLAIGKVPADFLMNGGLNMVMPMDLKSRMDMGSMIPATAVLDPSLSDDDQRREWTELGGAVGSLASKMIDSYNLVVREGAVLDAASNALPKFADSLNKGVQMATTGTYRNNKGQQITSASPVEAAMKILDMQPARIADEQRSRGIERRDVAIQSAVQKSFTDLFTKATIAGDEEQLQKLRDRLEQWNENNPRYPVAINEQRTIARRVEKANVGWQERSKPRKGMEWMTEYR